MQEPSDEVSMLSSMRFAPIDRHYRRRSGLINASASSLALAQENESLKDSLRRAVDRHALKCTGLSSTTDIDGRHGHGHEGSTTLQEQRLLLLDVTKALQDSNQALLAHHQQQVIQSHATIEDHDVLSSRLATASETGGTDAERVRNYDVMIEKAKASLAALERDRSELLRHMRDAAEERDRDVARLETLGPRRDVEQRMVEDKSQVHSLEREVAAMEQGIGRLQDAFDALDETEGNLESALRDRNYGDANLALEKLMDKLSHDLDYAKSKGWKLMEAVIGAEHENCMIAWEMLQQMLGSDTTKQQTNE